jgi:hypothetical protein
MPRLPYGLIFIDGSEIGAIGPDDDEISVDIALETERPASAPLGWLHAAGVRLRTTDTEEDVTLWVSTGDPGGTMAIRIQRTPDGKLVLLMPHPYSFHYLSAKEEE